MVWNNLGYRLADQTFDEIEKLKAEAREKSLDYLQGRMDQAELSPLRVLFGDSRVGTKLYQILAEPKEVSVIRSVLEDRTSEE